MAPGGQVAAATQGGSKITLMEGEVKLGRGRTVGTLSGTVAEAPGSPIFKMPVLKIEDEGTGGGRPREDGHRVGGAGGTLGSAGQSPSSPFSPHSSPSSSLPSPSISPGRSFPNSAAASNPNFDQNNLQQNFTCSKDGFYIPGSQVSAQVGQLGERKTLSPCFTGSLKENSLAVPAGGQTLKPSLEKESASQPAGTGPPGPRAGLAPGVGVSDVWASEVERENLSHTEKGRAGSSSPPSRGLTGGVAIHGPSQDLSHVEDGRVGSCATLNRQTKTSQSSEVPQRTAVRRAMSDCSHLSVPMVMAGTYPTGMGGSPVMLPSVPNFALMGAACPPRPPYAHVAVRRSLTVTDGTEAAAAVATMMSSPLMTSPVMPSSPPPKRHHGSCETSFLLAVPPPVGTSISNTQDNKLNITGKSFFLYACVTGGLDVRKHNQ